MKLLWMLLRLMKELRPLETRASMLGWSRMARIFAVIRIVVAFSHDIGEVIKDNLFLAIMLGYPPIVVLESQNVIFTPPSIHPQVKKFRIGIALLQAGDTCTLLFPRALEHRQTDHPPLESGTEVLLPGGEQPRFLRYIQFENNQEGSM